MPKKNKNTTDTNNSSTNQNYTEIANYKLQYKQRPIVKVEKLHEDDNAGLYKVELGKIKVSNSEIQQLKSEMKEFKSEMNELKSEMKEFKSEMNEFKSEMKEMKTSIEDLKKQMTNLTEIVATGFKNVNTRLDNLEKDVAAIKACPTIQKELKTL